MGDSQIFGEPRSIQIELEGRRGKVLVGGQDITKAVRSFRIDADPYGMNMTLDLALIEVAQIDSDSARVAMSTATRQLLIDAGWTPPVASAPEPEGLA